MSTKPFKKVISQEDMNNINVDATTIKPFKVSSKKTIDTSETLEPIDDILESDNTDSIVTGTNFFSTFNGLLAALLLFVVIAVIADTIDTLSDIFNNGTLSSYIYLGGLVLLLVVLLLNILSNLKQLKFIKNAKRIKERFILQKQNPTEEIIPLANLLLDQYSKSKDEKVIQSIEHIQDELNTSQIYEEIYRDLDSVLLPLIDAKAKAAIHKASMQAALSTAISPFALFDMLLVFWRSVSLTKEISAIYGFRPGGLSTIILLKQAMVNVAFAGVAELLTEFSNEASGTLFTSISKSAGQGIANGVLLARLGYGVMQECRPIETAEARGSFIKKVMLSIFKAFKPKEQDKNVS